MRRRQFLCAGGGLLLPAGQGRAAGPWPTRPLRLLVPYAPGGGADILARTVMRHVSERLQQPIVVENRGGANTIIGTQQIVQSAPDGYNFVVGTSSLAMNPFLYRRLPFEAERDLVPVALLATVRFVLVVNPLLPVRSVQDLVAHGRAAPGGLIFGSYGAGSTAHLTGLLFGRAAGVEVTHVAYPGSSPVLIDLMAGRLAFAFSTILPAVPEIGNGRLRALAVTTPERVNALPHLPTMQEAWMPGFEAAGWNSVHAPAGTPEAALQRMSAEMLASLDMPEVRRFFGEQGYVIPPAERNTPAALAALQRSDAGKWGRIIEDASVRLD
ncbi:tripartite tricarboxylate transporter substrate binding protein [Pararoseomonas sp. SCSIO 73927]|uniref:Bug family tripartite tricarboxylate transporter substrate binding protein n=1 Tax=Pararoseomonas sp. SCSIO 73927 TaxID=3114537 RepID=UPI0030CE7455